MWIGGADGWMVYSRGKYGFRNVCPTPHLFKVELWFYIIYQNRMQQFHQDGGHKKRQKYIIENRTKGQKIKYQESWPWAKLVNIKVKC